MSATVAATPWTLRFSAHRVGGKCVIVDRFRQTERSDFKRLRGYGTMAAAMKAARTRQQRWVARTTAKSAAARTSTLDALDTLDTLDAFPAITAADQAAEAAYRCQQDAIADHEAYWCAQAEEMAAEYGGGDMNGNVDADSNVDAACEAAWIK